MQKSVYNVEKTAKAQQGVAKRLMEGITNNHQNAFTGNKITSNAAKIPQNSRKCGKNTKNTGPGT